MPATFILAVMRSSTWESVLHVLVKVEPTYLSSMLPTSPNTSRPSILKSRPSLFGMTCSGTFFFFTKCFSLHCNVKTRPLFQQELDGVGDDAVEELGGAHGVGIRRGRLPVYAHLQLGQVKSKAV